MNIDRCLASLRQAVDEVIVVDTGSTDKTVEIARSHEAHLHSFAWCDDFAAARNESLRHARGDFILWIDADEELIESRSGELRQLCQALPASDQGYWLPVHSLQDREGQVGSVSRQWRVFRNRMGAQFQGRIHEQLALPSDVRDIRVALQNEVYLRHWGYIEDAELLQRKAARNRPLLEQAVVDDPASVYHRYSLAKHYAGEGDYQAALTGMEKAIDLWLERGQTVYSYTGHMFAVAALAAVQTGQHAKALEILSRTPDGYLSADVLVQAGLACWQLGRHDDAIKHLSRACSDASVQSGFECDPSMASWRPLYALALIHLELDRLGEAFGFAERALQVAPGLAKVLYALASIRAKQGDVNESVRWARQLLEGQEDGGYKSQARKILFDIGQATSNPELMVEASGGAIAGIGEAETPLLLASAYGQIGNLQAQYEALDRGLSRYPGDFTIRFALASCLETAGHVPEALNVLSGGLDCSDPPAQLYIKLARLLTRQGHLEEAANALAIAHRLNLSPADGYAPVSPLLSEPEDWRNQARVPAIEPSPQTHE